MTENKKTRKLPAFLLKKKTPKYRPNITSKPANRYSAKGNFEKVILKVQELYQTLLNLKPYVKQFDRTDQLEYKSLSLHLKAIKGLEPQYVYTLNKVYNDYTQGKRIQRNMTRLQRVWSGIVYMQYTQFEAVDKYVYTMNEKIVRLSLLCDIIKRKDKEIQYGEFDGEMQEL